MLSKVIVKVPRARKPYILGETTENPKKSVTPRVSFKGKWGKVIFGRGGSYFTT